MKIFLATPAYGGVCSEYARSLVAVAYACAKNGIELVYATFDGCCYVTKARDVLFAQFLASDCTHLLWIDSDMAFTPSDVLAVLSAQRDVVAIAYPQKRYPLRWMFHVKVDAEGRSVVEDGLAEISEAGTGFLCVSRQAAEAIDAAWASRVPAYELEDGALDHEAAKRLRAYFSTEIIGGRWISEDYVFCRRWTEIGGRIWLHLGATVTHVGAHRYEGKPSDFLVEEEEAT